MAAIQFFGRPNVLSAYAHRGIEVWAIFNGKNLITSGQTTDELDNFLGLLEPGGSAAPYILKVYRDHDADDITDKTECNGSFTFKLTDPGYNATRLGASDPGINERFERLENLIVGYVTQDAEDKPEKDENDLMSIIMGYLKEPQKLALVINAVRGFATNAIAPVPAAVGSVTPGANNTEENLQRLSVALDKLERADPKIVEHLEALADIAEKKPPTFKMLLSMLDNGL